MKNFITALLLIAFSLLNAQQISDYKYIIVPQKFNDFEENQYKLNTYLKNLLKKKNYEILTENAAEWPSEVQQNSCLAATADVKKLKNLLKNKVEIVFTNCEQKQVGIVEGTSSLSQIDKGYQDALKIASGRVFEQKARPVEQIHKNKTIPVEIVKAPEINPAENQVSSNGSTYSNGEITLTKSDLADGSFYLINDKTAQIYAQFFPSSKQGIYKVKVIDPKGNYETIGYFDGTNVEIEQTSADNKSTLIQFKKQ